MQPRRRLWAKLQAAQKIASGKPLALLPPTHPLLRTASLPVPLSRLERLVPFARQLALTATAFRFPPPLTDVSLLGLSAVQVGLPCQLFVMLRSSTQNTALDFHAVVNPRVLSRSDDLVEETEACASLPGVLKPILRPSRILVEYHTLQGQFTREILTGLGARVFLHEYDHIRGWMIDDDVEG
jgi:peptide deformylase